MTHHDFEQLPASIQREFVLNACEHLFTIRIDQGISIDLFYSCNGDFFVELYISGNKEKLLNIKSFCFNDHHLDKFLKDIDISAAYDILRDKW